jgi:hypothetical protein
MRYLRRGVLPPADSRCIPDNTAAYELYLKGQAQLSRFTPNELRAAVDSFDEAIRLDPNYAPAYGGLAMACAAIRLRGAPDSETRAWGERAGNTCQPSLAPEFRLPLQPHQVRREWTVKFIIVAQFF